MYRLGERRVKNSVPGGNRGVKITGIPGELLAANCIVVYTMDATFHFFLKPCRFADLPFVVSETPDRRAS